VKVSSRRRGRPQISVHDPDAEFTALVHRQTRFVFRVAYAVLLNAYDAEDAVQESFMKLYRNRGWQQADNERAYLARVAWRCAIDLRAMRSTRSTSSEPIEVAAQIPAAEIGPEQLLLSADQQASLHAMIDALPEELRLPLVLSSFEEMNSRAIASVLEIPEGTVRTRLQRARQTLREKLTRLWAHRTEAGHA
jgi:RNA polymerase sigma-70 factor (ECF subfamily)